MAALTSPANVPKDWISEANPLGPPANPATATKLNASGIEDLENRLWAAVGGESTALQAYADGAAAGALASAQAYADGPITTTTFAGNLTLDITAVATILECTSNGAAITVTIPLTSGGGAVAWLKGHWFEVAKMGTADVNVAIAGGGVLRPSSPQTITTQYAGMRFRMSSNNVWVAQA